MLRYRDKGQNKKRSLTFCTGVKFSRWSDFDENRLKLIRLSHGFKKCIVCHTLNVGKCCKQGGQRLVPTQVYECQMGVTFELLFSPFPNILPMANYTFFEPM